MRLTIPLPLKRKLVVILRKYHRVLGVSSKLPDGRHILMWDFDGISRQEVMTSLLLVQSYYRLPEIRVVETRDSHFHGFCFEPYHFDQAMVILHTTPGIDETYWKMGVLRGYWTLRFYPRKPEPFRLIARLPGRGPGSIDPRDITNFTIYYTGKDDIPDLEER